MKLALVLVLLCGVAAADDFDSWKIPDALTLSPARCGSEVTECLHLAWTAEAGILGAGQTDAQRLEAAAKYFQKACDLAKKKPCANADRVTAKLAKVNALTTDADRARFWCGDALDGARLFASDKGSAVTIVRRSCAKLFPAGFQRGLHAVGGGDDTMKAVLVLQAALEELCPTQKPKSTWCSNKDAGKVPAAKVQTAIAAIIAGSMGDLAPRSTELASWLVK
jgi:hypothetical protein